jgi:hypothetical protein
MITSEARISTSRQNAKLSTGPKTPEGKERSRRNGLKHGMTGKGIVVLEQDAAEVDIRHLALHKELAPQSIMGAILVGQMATLSVRMERGARQEFAAVAIRARHAGDVFDAERSEAAKELLKTIGSDPREIVRKLLKSPEGVELMAEAWHDLRDSKGSAGLSPVVFAGCLGSYPKSVAQSSPSEKRKGYIIVAESSVAARSFDDFAWFRFTEVSSR